MKRRIPLGATGSPGGGFSLIDGDPLFELQRLAHLVGGRHAVAKRALLVAAVAWLPAIVLGLRAHAPTGTLIPLHARFLIAIPVLLWAERFIDARVRAALDSFPERGIVTPDERPRFQALVDETTRQRRSVKVAVGIVAVAFGISALGDLGQHTPRGSPAAWWIIYVSLPVFRIVLFQWLWRWVVWVMLLARIARLRLDLAPTHPDLAGGLGFLEPAAMSFLSLQVAAGAVVAGRLITGYYASATDLRAHSQIIVGFALIAIAMVLGPLVFFSPHLLRAKRRGQLEQGALSSRHDRLFERRWRRADAGDPLGDPSISSLADLGTSYGPIDRMRPLPIGRRSLVGLLAVCAAPALPAILTRVSLPEMLTRAAKALLM